MARKALRFFVEGAQPGLQAFVQDLKTQPPPAASIAQIEVHAAAPVGLNEFTIRESQHRERPTVRISPDLPVCDDCRKELFDPADPRYCYPYINCTNCGPRYTVIVGLPYDRHNTTMKHWPLDDYLRCAISRSRQPPLSRAARRLPEVAGRVTRCSPTLRSAWKRSERSQSRAAA